MAWTEEQAREVVSDMKARTERALARGDEKNADSYRREGERAQRYLDGFSKQPPGKKLSLER